MWGPQKLSSQEINQYGFEHTVMKGKLKQPKLEQGIVRNNNQIIETVIMFIYTCYQRWMIIIKQGKPVVNQTLIK